MEVGSLVESSSTGLDRPLIAYAFLAQTRSDTTDLMSGLAPIFVPIAKQLQGKPFVADEFAKKVREIYGIKIHPWAAEDLAPRLEACGVLVKDPVSESAMGYVYAIPSSAPAHEDVTESHIRALLQDFSTYAREQLDYHGLELSDSEAEQVFLEHLVLSDFSTPRTRAAAAECKDPQVLSLKKENSEETESASPARRTHLDIICAAYILNAFENNRAAYALIVRVAHGALLSEVVLNVQNPDSKVNLQRLTVVLDAPLVMSILDLRARESSNYARAFIKDLSDRGCFLKIFSHSIDEIEINLRSVVQNVKAGAGHGATARRLIGSSSFRTYLDTVISDIRGAIDRYDIKPIEVPATANSLLYFTEDEEASVYSNLGSYSNHQAQRRDAKSVADTVRLRRGVWASFKKFEEASYIFVTENDRVAERSSFIKPQKQKYPNLVPPALTDRFFAGLMWVTFGGKTDEITQHRLLANCVSALEPSSDLLNKVQKFLAELDDQKADHFRALMTEDRSGQHMMQLTLGDALLVRSTDDASDLLAKIEERQFEKHKKSFDEALAEKDLAQEQKEKQMQIEFERTQLSLRHEADRHLLTRDLALVRKAASGAANAGKLTRIISYIFVSAIFVAVAAAPYIADVTALEPAAPYIIALGVVATIAGFWRMPDFLFGRLSRKVSCKYFATKAKEYDIAQLASRCNIDFSTGSVSCEEE